MTTIVAHRGARNLWPENTMTGFRNALDLGATAVEFDIHLTHAGELVVIHDPTLERTAESSGAVVDLSPEARAAVRLKNSEDGIPLLDELLEFLATRPGVEIHAELKAGVGGVPYPGLEAKVAAALERHGLADRSFMTSFNPSVLEDIRRAAPNVPRLISMNAESVERFGGFETHFARAIELARVVAVHHELFEDRFVEITAQLPMERLCVWTLNDEPLIARWLDRGVGYLTTDRPDLGLALQKR